MQTPGLLRAFAIPADVSALAGARREMTAALDAIGWDEQEAGRILLAGSEAVSNAIEHGSPEAGSVEIALEATGDQLVVRVRDHGRPGSATPVACDEEPPSTHIRGRGLLIMERLADSLAFTACDPAGTEVVLAFTPVSAMLTAPRQAA